jgi:chromosome segregation ATPase
VSMTIEPRRTAQPTGRSAKRQALADAIEQFNAAEEYLTRVVDAHAAKDDQYLNLGVELNRANREVAEAATGEPRRLVAALLSDGPDVDAGEDILADLDATVSKLEAARKRTKTEIELLEREQSNAEKRVAGATRRRNDALKQVVIAEGNIAALREQHDKLLTEASIIGKALMALSFALPVNSQGQVILHIPYPNTESPLATQIQLTLKALETDADAPLPSGTGS